MLYLLMSLEMAYRLSSQSKSTASAARNISGGPTPLRNAAFPDGLPSLEFAQRVRVSQANRLYAVCCEVAQVCQGQGVYWSVENPASSVFWATSAMQSLCRDMGHAILSPPCLTTVASVACVKAYCPVEQLPCTVLSVAALPAAAIPGPCARCLGPPALWLLGHA